MEKLLYVADGQLMTVEGGRAAGISCGAVENYKKNLREIRERREWKNSGEGAVFMGLGALAVPRQEEGPGAEVLCAAMLDESTLIYAARLENGCALQLKNLGGEGEDESIIFRRLDWQVTDLHCLPDGTGAAFSYGDGGPLSDIAVVDPATAQINVLTEGESADRNPFFFDRDTIYFDSRGIGFGMQTALAVGPARIMRLDLKREEIEDVAGDARYDYIKPAVTQDGSLYCVRKPYEKNQGSGVTLGDIVLFPVRLVKTLFNWLNFKSMMYNGESMRSGGENPAKTQQKAPAQLMVEDNVIQAEKNWRENKKRGEEFAGIIPRDWVLLRRTPDGREEILRRGVLDFQLASDGTLYYSNGNYLLRLDEAGKVHQVCQVSLANQLSVL